MTRFVTIYKVSDSPMDWDFHVSLNEDEVKNVTGNLEKRKVKSILHTR